MENETNKVRLDISEAYDAGWENGRKWVRRRNIRNGVRLLIAAAGVTSVLYFLGAFDSSDTNLLKTETWNIYNPSLNNDVGNTQVILDQNGKPVKLLFPAPNAASTPPKDR